jgi:hypothetical protein
LIEALGLVERTGPMEAAIVSMRDQIWKVRGQTVGIKLTRGDASLVEKAVVTGQQGAEAGTPAGLSHGALRDLQRALILVDTPDARNRIVHRRAPRRAENGATPVR